METKIGMIAAVSEALRFRKQNPSAQNEDIIQHITNIAMCERSNRNKMGMIVAASKAVSYIERNPQATEKDVIKHVMSESESMVSKIEVD